MKKQLFVLLAGATLLFAACKKESNSNLASTDTPSMEELAKKKGKPFIGSMTYTFVTNYDLPCDCGTNFPVGNLYGTGTISPIGNATSKIKPCATPLFSGETRIGDHIAIECGSFVTCDGELYCYTYPYNLMYTASGAVGTIKCDFVGGTGRFKKATGSFTGTITVPYGQGVAYFTNINGILY